MSNTDDKTYADKMKEGLGERQAVSPDKLRERQVVFHSILLFFAMEKEEQETYLPAIDPQITYVEDGDTGDTTIYPAQYLCMRSLAYLEVFPPRLSPMIGNMIYEMRQLVYLMAEISPYPPRRVSGLFQYSYLWLFGPPYSGVSGSANVLWSFLRRYARQILADDAWLFDYPMLSFEAISKELTVG